MCSVLRIRVITHSFSWISFDGSKRDGDVFKLKSILVISLSKDGDGEGESATTYKLQLCACMRSLVLPELTLVSGASHNVNCIYTRISTRRTEQKRPYSDALDRS